MCKEFIQNSLSDVVKTIRERFPMRFAKVFFCSRKIYRGTALSYFFLSTDRQMVEIQGIPPAEPVGGSVPAYCHRLTN